MKRVIGKTVEFHVMYLLLAVAEPLTNTIKVDGSQMRLIQDYQNNCSTVISVLMVNEMC